MPANGVPTTLLPSASLLDEVLGNRDGNTSRVPIQNLLVQLGLSALPYLEQIGWKARASEPVHDDFKVRIAGTWYSPDWLVIVGAGQSQRAANNASTTGDKTGESPGNVYAWNGTSATKATLGQAPFNTHVNVPNSIDFHLAHRLSAQLHRPVFIILHAVPGSGIGTWLPSTPGANWSDLVAKIGAAFAGAAGMLWNKATVDLFGWSQGEDEYSLKPLYTLSTNRFLDLVSGVQGATWASDELMFLATETLRQQDGGTAYHVNEEWAKLVASGRFDRLALVPSGGLETTGADTGQIVHFSGASLQEVGYRSANVYLGRSNGIASDGMRRAADATGQLVWRERPYTWAIELQIDASDTFPQTLTMQPTVDGLPVVFEVDGAFTEVASVNGAAVLEHDLAAASTVRIWYPTDAMRDQPPGFACTAAEGAGTLRSVRFNPLAELSSLYLANQPIKGRLVAATLPRSLETLRIQDAPGIIWTDFVPADLPPALTLLNFNDSLVPSHVQAAITVENAARGGTITVQSLGVAAGFGAIDVFTNVTEMTTAITKGFSRPDGWIAFISNSATGAVSFLQAKAGTAATPGEAPAGWRIFERSTSFVSRALLAAFVGAGGSYADGTLVFGGDLMFQWKAGASVIPDMPNVIPVNATFRHFGAIGDGAANDTVAALAAGAAGGHLRGHKGDRYFISEMQVAAGTVLEMKGAAFVVDGATVATGYAAAHILFDTGCKVLGDFRLEAAGTAESTDGVHARDGFEADRVELVASAEINSAGLVVTGQDCRIGFIYGEGFTRPFHADATLVAGAANWASGLQLGGHLFRGITRGIRVTQQEYFVIGEGAMYLRSVRAVNEEPGFNGFLFAGARHGAIADQYIADSGEHAIRMAGAAALAVSFGVLTLVRPSASPFKINCDTNVRAEGITVAGMNIIDPCTESGVSAKASHVLRISHTDGFTCGPVRITQTGDHVLSPGALVAIANSRGVHIESVDAPGMTAWQPMVLNDTNDFNEDTMVGCTDISIGRFRVEPPANGDPFVTINMTRAGSVVGDVRIHGIDQQAVRDAPANDFVDVVSAAGGFTGTFSFQGLLNATKQADWSDIPADHLVLDIIEGDRRWINGQTAFNPSEGHKNALFIWDTHGVQGNGAYGAGITGSQVGGGRPGWAIVGVQTTADPDHVGVAIFTSRSSTPADVLEEAARFHHNGTFELINAAGNPSMRVLGNQVVGPRVIDGDLGLAPNSGDANTDLLINAIVGVLTTHGLGAAS